MPKCVVSANYRDRQSELRWLVRREDKPVDSAVAVKSLVARDVQFTKSNEDESGFGCKLVAMATSVELLAEKDGGEKLTWDGSWFRDAAGKVVKEVAELVLSASGEVRSIPVVEPEPKVVKADVLNAIGQIRESAAKSEGDGRVNVDVAMVVVRALEDELGESPIVHIEPGGVDYARIADAVVERLDVIFVERVKTPQPDGMTPVPWRYNEMGCIFGGPQDENEIEVADLWVSQDGKHEDGRAIVEAVNAYFAPRTQSPTPTQAASANAETQIPDTAGYPVPDYDAVGQDIPSFRSASVPADPASLAPEVKAAFQKAVLSGITREKMARVSRDIWSVVNNLNDVCGLSQNEWSLAVHRITLAVIDAFHGIVAERPAMQQPAA